MNTHFSMPPIYRTCGTITGLPLKWRDEVTGVLVTAVERYLNHRIDGASIDEIDVEIVRAFMEHYINAPCWDHMNADEELSAELSALRRDVLTLRTPDHIGEWIFRCLDLGIDPL